MLDEEEYGGKTRILLGLSDSAVVECDNLKLKGYAGTAAKTTLVKASTATDGNGNHLETLPTDFRMMGIQELTSRGVPLELQLTMFMNFMRDYTKAQRAAIIAQYDAIKGDEAAVTDFCNSMASTLNY